MSLQSSSLGSAIPNSRAPFWQDATTNTWQAPPADSGSFIVPGGNSINPDIQPGDVRVLLRLNAGAAKPTPSFPGGRGAVIGSLVGGWRLSFVVII